MATVDLAYLLHHTGREPRSVFEVSNISVPITASGTAGTVVWWWQADVVASEVRASLSLGNAPEGCTPWMQDIHSILDAPRVAAGEAASLSMCTCNDDCRLSFRLGNGGCAASTAELPTAGASSKVDSIWAAAWAKVSDHQEPVSDAVHKDPKLFKQVLQVTEAIVVDPASTRATTTDGVLIDHRDAAELAWAYRAGS